jgi:two-component system sensor histidine kinase RpfC
MLVSVLVRPVWIARQYLALVLDITAISLAIYLTGSISPFNLIYIWIFISAGTRYGRNHLIFASVLSVLAYILTLTALGAWTRQTYEAVFFLLLLVALPLYQYSLLRKLLEARREAELANKAKGDFLAVMTHELRMPLTGVVGMTNLLQSTGLNAEQREYVDSIGSSAEVLRALIGDVLDLSKLDARKLHLESFAFDLQAVMQEVCGALETQALAKGLEMILYVDSQIPAKVIGDQLRVRQILFNLVGNAIKFTDHGEVRVRASSCPSGEVMQRPHLLLEVEDTGIGIAPDKLGEIFESFGQADNSMTRRYGGTGLGTTIARDLTSLMGGRIGVDSELGKGSRFWVRLPLQQGPKLAGPRIEERRLEGLCALVFENNATSRELILEVCGDLGMECQPVLDIGHLSAVMGRMQTVDLLILADSPDRQDLAALLDLFLRVLGADVPHLLLTYSARHVDRSKPCPNCLNKPFLTKDLVHRMLQVLGLESADPDPRKGEVLPVRQAPEQVPRILVAEDNAIAARVITGLLEKLGYATSLVPDGEEALARARTEDFAMAFVDLHMPKLDGIAFAEAYRAAEEPGSRLPVIALTASAEEGVKTRCLRAGMDDFLAKPVNQEELSAMVERYVDG